jgi:hypothetical protein
MGISESAFPPQILTQMLHDWNRVDHAEIQSQAFWVFEDHGIHLVGKGTHAFLLGCGDIIGHGVTCVLPRLHRAERPLRMARLGIVALPIECATSCEQELFFF